MCAQCRMETVFGSVERIAVKTEVGEQQVVSSAPKLKQSAFTHSFIDQSITYICLLYTSGPMTSTFLLPLAMGACTALGGNVVTDAFGVVALVALAPPVARCV